MAAVFPTVSLNGELTPLAEARVPVLDRGFLFGDGVYEVIPVYGGRPFRLLEHIDRLARSLELARIDVQQDWQTLVRELVSRNGEGDMCVYLQVTRGADTDRDHAFPAGIQPTVFAMCSELSPVPQAALDDGVAAITGADTRWARCDIKATSLLPNVLLRQTAVEAGATETLLFRDDLLTEGAASSVFVVRHGLLLTPPNGSEVLPGTTRDLVLELANRGDVPYRIQQITRAELANADEVWLASSSKAILPVTTIDGRSVGDGKPGPVWRELHRLYNEYKAGHLEHAA